MNLPQFDAAGRRDNHPLQWTGPGVLVTPAMRPVAFSGRRRPLNGFALYALMIATLQTIERLLRQHKHYGQANVIERLIQLHECDRLEFIELCQSINVWGGSGAVWDCNGFGAEEYVFRQSMIQLADEMHSGGFATERSNFISSVFRKWQAAGV